MEWLPSLRVAPRKLASFTTKYQIASRTLQFSLAPDSRGAETLQSVTSQPFWQSSPLTFVQQEKLPERPTSSADQWQNNIACWLSRSSVFTQQSRHDPGR